MIFNVSCDYVGLGFSSGILGAVFGKWCFSLVAYK